MMQVKMKTVEDWQQDVALYVYFYYIMKLASFHSKTGSVTTHGLENLPFTAPSPLILRTITTYLKRHQIPYEVYKLGGKNTHRIVVYDIPLLKKILEEQNYKQTIDELASCAEHAYNEFKKEMALLRVKQRKRK
jgi:hypothetical protein